MDEYKVPNIDEDTSSDEEELPSFAVTKVEEGGEKKVKTAYKSCNQYTYKNNNNHNLWTPFLVCSPQKRSYLLFLRTYYQWFVYRTTHLNMGSKRTARTGTQWPLSFARS